MREYGFLLTRILKYNDGIYDSVLIPENMGQWKPVFSHILCSENQVFRDFFFSIVLFDFFLRLACELKVTFK